MPHVYRVGDDWIEGALLSDSHSALLMMPEDNTD